MAQNNSPAARNGGAPRRSFEEMQQKDKRTIIISTPFTGKIAHSLINFDSIMSSITRDFQRGAINSQQFMEAQKEADKLAKMFDSEILNLRNRAKQRNRRNRPQAKRPRTVPAIAPTTQVPTAAPAPNGAGDGKPTAETGKASTAPTAKSAKKTKTRSGAAKAAGGRGLNPDSGVAAAS